MVVVFVDRYLYRLSLPKLLVACELATELKTIESCHSIDEVHEPKLVEFLRHRTVFECHKQVPPQLYLGRDLLVTLKYGSVTQKLN